MQMKYSNDPGIPDPYCQLSGLVPGLILGDTCIYEAPVNYREWAPRKIPDFR